MKRVRCTKQVPDRNSSYPSYDRHNCKNFAVAHVGRLHFCKIHYKQFLKQRNWI